MARPTFFHSFSWRATFSPPPYTAVRDNHAVPATPTYLPTMLCGAFLSLQAFSLLHTFSHPLLPFWVPRWAAPPHLYLHTGRRTAPCGNHQDAADMVGTELAADAACSNTKPPHLCITPLRDVMPFLHAQLPPACAPCLSVSTAEGWRRKDKFYWRLLLSTYLLYDTGQLFSTCMQRAATLARIYCTAPFACAHCYYLTRCYTSLPAIWNTAAAPAAHFGHTALAPRIHRHTWYAPPTHCLWPPYLYCIPLARDTATKTRAPPR